MSAVLATLVTWDRSPKVIPFLLVDRPQKRRPFSARRVQTWSSHSGRERAIWKGLHQYNNWRLVLWLPFEIFFSDIRISWRVYTLHKISRAIYDLRIHIHRSFSTQHIISNLPPLHQQHNIYCLLLTMCIASPIPSSSRLYCRSVSWGKRHVTHSQQPSSQPPHKKIYHHHQQRPPRKQQQQCRVSFSARSSLHIVTNLTFEYKPDLWLTSEQIQKKKRKIEMFAYLLKSKRIDKEDFDSTLLMGLEKHLHDDDNGGERDASSGTSMSSSPRQGLFAAVLREQRRQSFVGIQDVEALAMISRMKSQRARDRARIIGILQSLWEKCIYARAVR